MAHASKPVMASATSNSDDDKATKGDLLQLKQYSKSGDAEAFRAIVEKYQKLVWSVCWRVLKNTQDTEDAVQDTFAKLAQNADKVEANPASWLHSTAYNHSVSLLRAKATRRKHESRCRSTPIAAEEDRAREELAELIDVCLSELDEDHREIIVRRFYCGMSQIEIAKQLDMSQQNVSVRLSKATRQLRSMLRNRGLTVSSASLSACLATGLAEASVPTQVTSSLFNIGVTSSGFASATAVLSTAKYSKVVLCIAPAILFLTLAWPFLNNSGVKIDQVLEQLEKARTIQYTKTRTNYDNTRAVIGSSVERYQVLEGYLERVEQLDADGRPIRIMIANYRTAEVIHLDMRRKTYTTNIRLKRQAKNSSDSIDDGKLRQLSSQTELADYLKLFSENATQDLVAQELDGRSVIGCSTETKLRGSVWKRMLWVDQESLLPVRAEAAFSNDDPTTGSSDWVRHDFVFDHELPLSDFSTRPPEGFVLKQFKGKVRGLPLP